MAKKNVADLLVDTLAGAGAHLTGRLAVCADSCGPGNLHLINGLYAPILCELCAFAVNTSSQKTQNNLKKRQGRFSALRICEGRDPHDALLDYSL